MICPSCKCEYIAGVTQCPDCDVALVDALDAPASSPSKDDGIVTVWSGNDPREFAAVKEALDQAQIQFMDPPSSGYLIFPSMRAKMEIGVYLADRDRAEKVLEGLEVLDDHDDILPGDSENVALPESEGEDGDEITNEFPEDWDDRDQVSEVWGGNDEEMANTLMACFRENGIASHKLAEKGRWRVIVPQRLEVRAKEIVREVMEGAPPE